MNLLLTLLSPWEWARRCLKPSASRSRREKRERSTFRPRLEVLEDRTLLTAYMVTLATDNNFNGGGQQDNTQANSGDLRYCLTQADKTAGNTITLAKQVNGKPIDLQAALPDITQNMTIAPAAGVNATVERSNTANTNFRIFTIDAGKNVTFGAFTVQHGFLEGNARFNQDLGAGIYNMGILTLKGTTVEANQTDDYGGGIYNDGNLTLNGASIKGNQAEYGAGISNTGLVQTVPRGRLVTLQRQSGFGGWRRHLQ